ncbi:unnamed protein product [Clonostachys rosea f. rosea IK726]|uniref:Uncharacterized protein n=4 Tax=Clonostachys rosea f. rosea IK726 TaxID=1349383 RepID=A0ACA9UQY0_BIOOC|nr:unnamed protein product [Clonostachys rosea f. rosea IK726]CAG9951158.1 unnamed protein product [Clonostachys rosea f. rosea IK726]CAG9955825.1 unnamed protein product [Clonostachys rosea f. rosea IK726]
MRSSDASAARFDHEYDVVVVGSGCSGLTTALVAAKKGLRVLVLEKTDFLGGTTAFSGGGVWIPHNKHQEQIGVQDSRQEAERYMHEVLGDLYDQEKVGAFLETGPKMVDWMEQYTAVKFKPVPLPDYHPSKPGASVGRTLLTEAFDGRKLGSRVKEIRYPIRGYSAFGSMQADPADLPILTAPFSSFRNLAFGSKKIARYLLDLVRYGKGTELANGNALVGRLFYSALEAGVDFWRNSAPKSTEGREGSVESLMVSRDGGPPVRVRALRGVVLASGGLGRSHVAEKFVPHEWTAVPRGNVGDGILLAEAAGAHLPPPNEQNAIFAPMSLLHRSDGTVWRYPHFSIDRSKPGSLIVSRDGKRFANESSPYQEFVKTMHAKHIKRAFFIGDSVFLRKYGMGMALPWPYPIGSLLRHGYLIQGRTIRELARKMEVDETTLENTVSHFNRQALAGKDDDFHRGENIYDRFYGDERVWPNTSLAACAKAPFYALPLVPGNVSITWGVETNKDAQVVRADGSPISGLYAVGCDQNTVMKGAYPGGGSSIGPGMTFGFRAAEHLVAVVTTKTE